jgi:hypothetical protein
MITTRAEIKTLLKISTTTYDDIIDLLLPIIQDDIMSFLKNKFILSDIEVWKGGISFSGNTITDASSTFLTEGFVAGNIVVQDSKLNNGFYTVTNVTANTLTVSEDLTTESAENVIKINQIKYPQGLKLIFANMIGFTLNVKHGVKSESISRYSVSYANDVQSLINGYPDTITRPLLKWRKIYNDY